MWGHSEERAPGRVHRAGFRPEEDWRAISFSSEDAASAHAPTIGAKPESVGDRRGRLAAALETVTPGINWRRIGLTAAIVLGALSLLGLQISALVSGVGNRAQVDKVLASVTRLGEDLDPDFEAPLNSRLLNPNSGFVGLYRAQPLWKLYRENEACCGGDQSCGRYVVEGSTPIEPSLLASASTPALQVSTPFAKLYDAIRFYVQGLPDWADCTPPNGGAAQAASGPWWWTARTSAGGSTCDAGKMLKQMSVAVAQAWDRACARYCETNHPTTRYVGSLSSVDRPQCLCLRSCSGPSGAETLSPQGYRVFERAGPQDAS